MLSLIYFNSNIIITYSVYKLNPLLSCFICSHTEHGSMITGYNWWALDPNKYQVTYQITLLVRRNLSKEILRHFKESQACDGILKWQACLITLPDRHGIQRQDADYRVLMSHETSQSWWRHYIKSFSRSLSIRQGILSTPGLIEYNDTLLLC